MTLREQIATLGIRLRLAAGVLTRRKHVSWGQYAWLDIKALLKTRDAPLDGRCVVFDAGANRGQTAKEIRRWLPRVDLHCFEPVPETFQQLRANVEDAMLHPYGLASRVGTHRMDVSGNDLVSRVLKDSSVEDDPSSVIEVELSTVDAEMEKHGLDRLHVLKVDVEGHEISVLEGADRALSEGRIDLILLEVRFGSSGGPWQTPLEDILEHLEPRGFRTMAAYTHATWLDSGINDADVLLMRVEGQPHAYLRSPLVAFS
jgi:FkbM family methyltransferase